MNHRKRSLNWKSIAKVKVFTYWEIVAFVVFVLFVAYMLFPKGKVEKFLEMDPNYNYPLAKFYLENILTQTKDPRLVYVLIKKNEEVGEFDKAYKLLKEYEPLLKSSDLGEKVEPLKLKLLLKVYAAARGKKKEQLRREIVSMVDDLLSSGKRESIKEAYETAVTLGLLKQAAKAAYKLALLTKKEKWIVQSFRLSWALGDKNMIKKTVEACLKYCKNPNPKLLRELFYAAAQTGDKKLYEKVALVLLNRGIMDEKLLDNLINLELSTKDYSTALRFCQLYYEKYPEFRVLKKCLNLALWSGNRVLVKKVIEENLPRYSRSKEALSYFLKVAVAQNLRELSNRIADQLLKVYGGK